MHRPDAVNISVLCHAATAAQVVVAVELARTGVLLLLVMTMRGSGVLQGEETLLHLLQPLLMDACQHVQLLCGHALDAHAVKRRVPCHLLLQALLQRVDVVLPPPDPTRTHTRSEIRRGMCVVPQLATAAGSRQQAVPAPSRRGKAFRPT